MPLFGIRTFCVLLFSLVVLDPARLHAQHVAASPYRTAELASYLALLGRYEAGDYPGAADAAARLNVHAAQRLARLVLDDIDQEMVLLRRLKSLTPEATTSTGLNDLRRERVRRLRLTLLVHTEAALRALDVKALGAQLTIARDAIGRLRDLEEADRRVNGPPSPSPAPTPASALPEWEGLKPFIRDWYLVVASRLQRGDQLVFLKRHVREGLELLGDDPELLLTRGSISEAEANTAVVDRSLAREIYASDYVHRWRQYMSAAGGDYLDASRRQPDLFEATLRWGRINTHLGDRTAAHRALDTVAASNAPAQLRYLAQLFLGDLAEREQQPDRARTAYESALALFPAAQAPMLALSLLCDSSGDSACARQWLSKSLSATGRGRLDPWWAYQRGQAWLGDARLVAFRRRGLDK